MALFLFEVKIKPAPTALKKSDAPAALKASHAHAHAREVK